MKPNNDEFMEIYKTTTSIYRWITWYLKQKQKPIDLYECINGDNEQLLKHKLATLNTFEEGMKQYFMKEFAMAAVTFQQIVKKERNDSAAKLFLNRSAHMITQETGDDWKGIASISSK